MNIRLGYLLPLFVTIGLFGADPSRVSGISMNFSDTRISEPRGPGVVWKSDLVTLIIGNLFMPSGAASSQDSQRLVTVNLSKQLPERIQSSFLEISVLVEHAGDRAKKAYDAYQYAVMANEDDAVLQAHENEVKGVRGELEQQLRDTTGQMNIFRLTVRQREIINSELTVLRTALRKLDQQCGEIDRLKQSLIGCTEREKRALLREIQLMPMDEQDVRIQALQQKLDVSQQECTELVRQYDKCVSDLHGWQRERAAQPKKWFYKRWWDSTMRGIDDESIEVKLAQSKAQFERTVVQAVAKKIVFVRADSEFDVVQPVIKVLNFRDEIRERSIHEVQELSNEMYKDLQGVARHDQTIRKNYEAACDVLYEKSWVPSARNVMRREQTRIAETPVAQRTQFDNKLLAAIDKTFRENGKLYVSISRFSPLARGRLQDAAINTNKFEQFIGNSYQLAIMEENVRVAEKVSPHSTPEFADNLLYGYALAGTNLCEVSAELLHRGVTEAASDFTQLAGSVGSLSFYADRMMRAGMGLGIGMCRSARELMNMACNPTQTIKDFTIAGTKVSLCLCNIMSKYVGRYGGGPVGWIALSTYKGLSYVGVPDFTERETIKAVGQHMLDALDEFREMPFEEQFEVVGKLIGDVLTPALAWRGARLAASTSMRLPAIEKFVTAAANIARKEKALFVDFTRRILSVESAAQAARDTRVFEVAGELINAETVELINAMQEAAQAEGKMLSAEKALETIKKTQAPMTTALEEAAVKSLDKVISGQAKVSRDGSVARGARFSHSQIKAKNLKMSQTVRNHALDIIKKGLNKGELSRPYVYTNGVNFIIDEIMAGSKPSIDKFLRNGLRWDSSGSFGAAEGIWELSVDLDTKTIVHFLFKSTK